MPKKTAKKKVNHVVKKGPKKEFVRMKHKRAAKALAMEEKIDEKTVSKSVKQTTGPKKLAKKATGKKRLFSFKQKSQDFIVEEKLPFKLSGRGDVLYVYFEKRNLTTTEILEHLSKRTKLSRKQMGIAGLKDKDAITRQWICVYKKQLASAGGERAFLAALDSVARIIEVEWHTKPLTLSSPIVNHFALRLRGLKQLSSDEKKKVEKTIKDLMKQGVPNYFGDQRFGINKRNIEIGRKIIDEGYTPKKSFETAFKLQSYASFLFNQYLNSRTKKKLELVDGDVLSLPNGNYGVYYTKKDQREEGVYEMQYYKGVGNRKFEQSTFAYPSKIGKRLGITADLSMITGAVWGYNTPLCPKGSGAAGRESDFMKRNEITKERFRIFKNKKIFGRRRFLRMFPESSSVRWQGDDLLLEFDLRKSMYASVLIDELFARINS